MKKKYIFVVALLIMMTVSSAVVCVVADRDGVIKANGKEILVVTSFYPVYVAAQNVADGIDGVRIEALSQPSGGCVHDYQLTTEDMMLLEQADIFIINGAGMEGYLEDVRNRYPDLMVVDSSVGTSLLEEGGGHHHEDETEHSHNSHIWLDMDNYCIQIGNIGNGMAVCDSSHQKQYQANAASYQKQVSQLLDAGRKELEGAESLHAIGTHEAFAYLIQNFGDGLEGTINMDENTSLGAADVSVVIEEALEHQIRYVWAEETYGTRLSHLLEQEVECQAIILDILVSGKKDKDAYLRGMRRNIDALKEACQHE